MRRDPVLCAPCNNGDHRSHTDDGRCANDNNFNADCECTAEPLSAAAIRRDLPDDSINRQEVMDWLAHRCDYVPPCGQCAYCRVAYAISVWSRATTSKGEQPPLCPVHKNVDENGNLEMQIGGNNCVACSLNEQKELLDILAPLAAPDGSEDSLTVLRRAVEFYETHAGANRVVVSYPAPQPALDAGEQWYVASESSSPEGDATIRTRGVAAPHDWIGQVKRKYAAQIVSDRRSAAAVLKLAQALKSAVHAMKSYYYGNSSMDLLREVEKAADEALATVNQTGGERRD